MRNYGDFAARLGSVLSNDGAITVTGAGGTARVALVTAAGRRFDFGAGLEEIITAVERLDGTVLAKPADTSPLAGQLRLFSVHVEEAVATAAANARHLELRSCGVVAVC